jgi:hypothetical protein
MTDLQTAVEALEKAGFHVDTAREESNYDVGNRERDQGGKTGAIRLRATPIRFYEPLVPVTGSR